MKKKAKPTAQGTMMRRAKVINAEYDGGASVGAASVWAFDDNARDALWQKGNVLLFRMASVRPDQSCLKLDQEAVAELVEKNPRWVVFPGVKTKFLG